MIYVVTLTFNLFSEVQKATERMYRQNEGTKFKHLLVDLGFPLIQGGVIPDNIEDAKEHNTECLKSLARRMGSEYIWMVNEGISQNWSAVVRYLQPNDEDVIVSCEPDEVQMEDGWVQALADVINGGMAYCAPRLTEHKKLLETSPHAHLETIGGHEVYVMNSNLNYGQIAFSAGFIKGGIAVPHFMNIYGGIEGVLDLMAHKQNRKWGLLKNITTMHTDFEKGTVGSSSLLRAWKNFIIFERKNGEQITFEHFLIKKKSMVKLSDE